MKVISYPGARVLIYSFPICFITNWVCHRFWGLLFMGHYWGTQGDISGGIFAGNEAKFLYADAKLLHFKINTLKHVKQQKQQQKNPDWKVWPLLFEEKSNPRFQLHANHFWWTISNPPFNSFHTDISSVLYIHMHEFLYFYVCASPVAVWTLFVNKTKNWWKVLALSCSRHMFLFVCFLFCFCDYLCCINYSNWWSSHCLFIV